MAYIDTSILVAYYCPEILSDQVETILRNTSNPAISHLTEVEFASALAKKIREKNLANADSMKIFSLFQSHIHHKHYSQLLIEPKHYSTARDWISQFNTPLRTLDALHLSIAVTNNKSIITADQQLAESAEILGIEVNLIR
jgi:predicted nucleic acid-binding protein